MDPQILTVVTVAAVILGLGFGGKLLFGSKERVAQAGPSTHDRRKCACGWQGMVSRFVQKCPRCGSPV